MVNRYRTALIIFVFTFGVYLLTISPTINWRDTPEFANVAYNLGIAHPAGFPAYSLTAKLLTIIPFGSIPFRTNLFALICAVLSFIVLFALCQDILNHISKEKDEKSIITASLLASALLFVNSICWRNSVISEVYTYNMFLTLTLIWFAVKYSITKEESYIYTGAFIYGIASGNHATVAFYLPAIIVFFMMETKRKRAAKFILTCSFFLFGFSVYLYLPLRSLTNPSFDWGDPQTLTQFIMHITDRKTSYSHFAGIKDYFSILRNMANYLSALNDNITIAGIALSLTGAVHLYKKWRSFFWFIFLILISNVIFFFDWNGGVQLPSYICYMIFISAGIMCIMDYMKDNGRLRINKLFIYAMIAVVTVLGINTYIESGRARVYTGDEDFKGSFLRLPEKSMVITSYLYFHYKYYQDILGLRNDITLLGYGEILYPKLYSLTDKGRYPDISLIDFDADITATAKVSRFVNLNFKNYDRIFTEAISEFKGMENYLKHYDGMLFEFTRSKIDGIGKEDAQEIRRYFDESTLKFVYDADYTNDSEASFIYVQDFISIIDYMMHFDYINDALYMIQMMETVHRDFQGGLLTNDAINLKVLTGVAHIKLRDFDKAKAIFNGMIEKDEHKSEAYNKLGFIYKYLKEYDKAIKNYELAIKESPGSLENYVELGDIYERSGELDKAEAVYSNGIKRLFQDEKKALKEKIDDLHR